MSSQRSRSGSFDRVDPQVRRGARRQSALIVACWIVVIGLSVPFVAFSDAPGRSVIHVIAYSLSFLVAGTIACIRRPGNRVGVLMLAVALTGSLTYLGRLHDPAIGRLAGLSGSMSNLLVAWVVLSAPSGQLGRGLGRALLVAFGAVLLVTALVQSLDVLRVMYAIGVGISLAIALVVLRRWTDATAASRRSLTPVVIAGVTISLVHAVDLASGVLLIPVLPGSPLYWADTLSRLLVPFGFLIGLLRLRMARGALADLVVDLGEIPPPERLREALSGALRDPTLAVLYWSPERAAYLDAHGVAVDAEAYAAGRAVTYLEHGDEPLAAMLHDPALSEDPGLVAAVAAAVRLAVENERLTSEVEAQLHEVQASRARIVAAGDAERRRVERDLHDGAQQRIVSMTLALRLARIQLGNDADPVVRQTLDQASDDAKAALSELRELARGIHPQILSEAGLGAAVDSLVARSPVEMTVDVAHADRYSPAVESTAYFVVSEALANIAKYANASHGAIRTSWRDDILTIDISDDGVGGADPAAGTGLRGLADRLSVVDGTLEVTSPRGGGTRLRASIPAAIRSIA